MSIVVPRFRTYDSSVVQPDPLAVSLIDLAPRTIAATIIADATLLRRKRSVLPHEIASQTTLGRFVTRKATVQAEHRMRPDHETTFHKRSSRGTGLFLRPLSRSPQGARKDGP